MNRTFTPLLIFFLTFTGPVISAEDDSELTEDNKQILTEEELETRLGRYGEPEEIPEGFSFNQAETRLWLTDHFTTVKEPVSMYYEFERTGSYDPGFVDSIYLKVLKINDDGTKSVKLDFLSGEKKQPVRPENVNNITGNPVLGLFLQGDVQNMQFLTEGHYRHFIKQIKVALREVAKIEPVTFTFNGKDYKGEKIFFSPYLNDPHRSEFERFAGKTYEFILSEQIPGALYQIKTVIPDVNKPDADKPLIQETITLMDVK